jgi:dihydroorotate dehydrogenase (NAD+) catalytic subunit
MKLEQTLFGARFQNPVLLAAGTCGFGEELSEVADLGRLGGLVTKSITIEPRQGNPAPRVAEVGDAMINSIGLTNPGLARVCAENLPWVRDNLSAIRVFVSVAGHRAEEYFELVERIDQEEGFLGFEINLSCPNDTRLGGLPFSLDPEALGAVVRGIRERTKRPVLVKLAPNTPDIGDTAAMSEDAGADGITLVNTMPGLVIDAQTRRPVIGAGAGGLSGPAMRAVAVHAVAKARARTSVPLIGVGGVTCAADAVQFLLAGASLVQVGTASFADPRAAERVVAGLELWGRDNGVGSLGEIIGAVHLGSGAATKEIGGGI